MTRVALDLMGGDHAPAALVDGALLAAEEQPGVEVVLVGPADVADALLAERDASGRCPVVEATEVVEMDEKPARGVRTKPDSSVAVCARLVRDGEADAMVSVGSSGATLTAAVLELGRLPGVTRPSLAAVLPSAAGLLVFLDAGANPEPSCELLAQYALAGVALARIRLGIAEPRVALLSIGEEAGKGDAVRKEAYDVLRRLPIDFVGNCEGGDVAMGGVADVIVTDGFAGNVLIKGLEGAAAMLRDVLLEDADESLRAAVAKATARLDPDVLGGAVLLGVEGVVVVGHGAAGARAVASCIAVAAQAAEAGLVPKVATALAELTALAETPA